MTRPRAALRPRVLSSAILGVALAAGLLPAPVAVVAAPDARPAAPAPSPDARPLDPAEVAAIEDTAGQHPSVVYEQAMEHAGDRIAFEPGGRVDVGFTPRAGDGWPVDGRTPEALPAGRASGLEIAASRQGSRWAETGTADGAATDDPAAPDGAASDAHDAPVDAPAGSAIPAEGASSVAPAGATGDLAAASGLRRQVFGFLPYWELSSASTLNYDVLSTIAYFSVGADRSGNLLKKTSDGTTTTGWSGWSSSRLASVISAAHSHGTRVVLTVSVFAWTTNQATIQKTLLGSSTARANLARQVAAAVRDRGADGVNLDFEPIVSGYADEFVALIKSVRAELNKVHSGYQVTYDTTGYIGNYPLEASVAAGAADAIFVMGYDYRTASSGSAGSVDPLSGPAYDLTDTVRAYTARVAPSRVILGIPWYGRAWSTTTDDLHAKNQSGAKYGYSAAVNYESAVDLVAKYGRRWDSVEQSPWFAYQRQNCTATYGCVTSWRSVYYDDAASMRARYAMINAYGLRGAGIWALGYDGGHSELYRALSDSFLVDKSGPQAGITLIAATQVDEGFVVRWSASDVSAIASYDVQAAIDGGAWTAWLTGTKATSDVWLGRDGHGYAFRVRARDSKGNVGSWNVTSTWSTSPALAAGGFARVKVDGLAYRTGPDTSALKLGTLDLNTIVAVTAGPVSADGYAWWEVTQPIREWAPVSFVERGVWIAGSSSTATYLAAYRAPNATTVDAGLRDFGFAADGADAVGTSAAETALRAFSPNSDGAEDSLRLRWTSALDLDGLTLNVFRTDGSLAGSRSVPVLGAGARAWAWDGELAGSTLPDGRYVLQLAGTAGGTTYRAPSARPVTSAQVAAYAVTIDTVAPTISSATASSSLISPNGDGTRDSVAYALAAAGGAVRWQVRVSDAAGTAARTVSGTGTKASVTWTGRDDHGALVADGRYTATLSAFDEAGNRNSRSFAITVDTTAPAVVATASPASFSPDGDGVADRIGLHWSANEKGSGAVRIYRGTTLVRSWTVSSLGSWSTSWNGRTASGSSLADGSYRFRVDVRDAGGNRRVVDTAFVMDRTAGFLRWSRSFYPQDGDALAPTSVVSFRLARQATTTLRILDAKGAVVRTVWTDRVLAAGTRSWTWNGRTAAGAYVPPGSYVAELVAKSSLGTTRLTRGVTVNAFRWSLSATTVRPGQTLTMRFWTVEPLSTRPTVRFTQPGRPGVTATATRLSDGSYRVSFTVASGSPGAATLRISARDSGGRTNAAVVGVTIGS